MSDAVAPGTPAVVPAAAPVTTAATDDRFAALEKTLGDIAGVVKGLGERGPGRGVEGLLAKGQAPHGTSGPLGDRPYSFLRAIAAKRGLISPDQAKYEFYVSDELRKSYNQTQVGQHFGFNSFLAPNGVDFLCCENDREDRLVGELRQKFLRDRETFVDPDEVGYLRKSLTVQKALGTNVDTAGGPLVGFPAMGELVDMQRNLETFSNAGATQVPLGPNGQMFFPKLISGATAYFVPENPATGLSTSQPTTGSLALMAKTLAVRVPLSNQLLKFNLVSAEAMVRTDMARVAALKADSSMFAGVGGNEIKGLLTYDTQSTWSSGTDKLVATTATTTGGNGDTLNSIDLYKMIGSLPDMIADNLTWVVKKSYWWNRIATARAGGSTTGDGPYLLSIIRSIEDGVTSGRFLGNRLLLTSQVPNRTKGSGTTLTCVILGYFPDWLIGRAGVVEMDMNPYGDTAWANIQTEIRLVQYIDAGPRHAASFGVCDSLLTSAFTA